MYRQGDITILEIDSIVNAANNRLGGAAGFHFVSNNLAETTDQVVPEVNPQAEIGHSFTNPAY